MDPLCRRIVLSISIFSKSLTWFINNRYSSFEQNPITGSTIALLYQLLSKKTISPGFGRFLKYLWKYHCPSSNSDGLDSATTLEFLGFKCSTNLFIAPPFPAASRPSKIIHNLLLFALIQFCSNTNSDWSVVIWSL